MNTIINYFRTLKIDRSHMHLMVLPYVFAKRSTKRESEEENTIDFPTTGIKLLDDYHLECMQLFNQGPFATRIVKRKIGDGL